MYKNIFNNILIILALFGIIYVILYKGNNPTYKIYIYLVFITIIVWYYTNNIHEKLDDNIDIGSNNNKKINKIAICFFGICRSTPYTIESIKNNIYNQLDNMNINYDVYSHTYNINKDYNNTWSQELNIKINNDNCKLLNSKYVLIEDEDEIKEKINIESYRTHGNPWASLIGIYTGKPCTDFITLDNAILSLYSTYQVTNMWKQSGIEYDAIIYLRPDVLYINPLTKDYFNLIDDNLIIIPNFAEHPINDRFAIGNPHVMQIYGERYTSAYKYSLENQLHTESFLNDYLIKNNIKILKINFKFCRMSINGINRDTTIVNECAGS
jgi:hypothetical protein